MGGGGCAALPLPPSPLAPSEPVGGEYEVVWPAGVRLRASADPSSRVVGVVKRGGRLAVSERRGGWVCGELVREAASSAHGVSPAQGRGRAAPPPPLWGWAAADGGSFGELLAPRGEAAAAARGGGLPPEQLRSAEGPLRELARRHPLLALLHRRHSRRRGWLPVPDVSTTRRGEWSVGLHTSCTIHSRTLHSCAGHEAMVRRLHTTGGMPIVATEDAVALVGAAPAEGGAARRVAGGGRGGDQGSAAALLPWLVRPLRGERTAAVAAAALPPPIAPPLPPPGYEPPPSREEDKGEVWEVRSLLAAVVGQEESSPSPMPSSSRASPSPALLLPSRLSRTRRRAVQRLFTAPRREQEAPLPDPMPGTGELGGQTFPLAAARRSPRRRGGWVVGHFLRLLAPEVPPPEPTDVSHLGGR